MDIPPFGFGFIGSDGPISHAPKAIRIEKAENGFVVYLRKPNMTEEIRIAPSLQLVHFITREYFTTPVNVNESKTYE